MLFCLLFGGGAHLEGNYHNIWILPSSIWVPDPPPLPPPPPKKKAGDIWSGCFYNKRMTEIHHVSHQKRSRNILQILYVFADEKFSPIFHHLDIYSLEVFYVTAAKHLFCVNIFIILLLFSLFYWCQWCKKKFSAWMFFLLFYYCVCYFIDVTGAKHLSAWTFLLFSLFYWYCCCYCYHLLLLFLCYVCVLAYKCVLACEHHISVSFFLLITVLVFDPLTLERRERGKCTHFLNRK